MDGEYPEEVRIACLTLHFYSVRAYNYLREIFNKSLPAPSTIRSWYCAVGGSAGHQTETLRQLKDIADDAKSKGYDLDAALICDEMAIRQRVHLNQSSNMNISGTVDYGNVIGIDNPDANDDMKDIIATDALTYMVSVSKSDSNERFKCVVAYFFGNKLASYAMAAITMDVIRNVTKTGINIRSLTFDGLPANKRMCQILGANFLADEVFISNRYCPNKTKIHIFFDVVHMIKCIRNNWHKYKVFFDADNNELNWTFFEKLHDFQKVNSRMVKKLTHNHLNFEAKKMNVALAVELFSNSVATAIETLSSENVEFAGSEPTSKFIKLLDKCIDALNSKTDDGKIFKQPISQENHGKVKQLFEESIDYISNLEVTVSRKKKGIITMTRVKILKSQIATGFYGLICSMRSTLALYNDHISNGNCKKLYMFQRCQDQLENWFGRIRGSSALGDNRNPTVQQFISAARRLICKNAIESSDFGNCQSSDIPILTISSRRSQLNVVPSGSDCQTNAPAIVIDESSSHVQAYTASLLENKLASKLDCKDCAIIFTENQKLCDDLVLARLDNEDISLPCENTVRIICIVDVICSNLKGNNLKQSMRDYVIEQAVRKCTDITNELYPASNFIHEGIDHKFDFIEMLIKQYIRIKWIELCRQVTLDNQKGSYFKKK